MQGNLKIEGVGSIQFGEDANVCTNSLKARIL